MLIRNAKNGAFFPARVEWGERQGGERGSWGGEASRQTRASGGGGGRALAAGR